MRLDAEMGRGEKSGDMSVNCERVDTLVVGGGPGALAEVLAMHKEGRRTLVVAERFGGCMEMLGTQSLQSYVSELSFKDTPIRLEDFLLTRTTSCPSGDEYARYIRACFDAADTQRLYGRVESVQQADARLEADIFANGRRVVISASRVILASGLRPRHPDYRIPAAKWRTCFQAYKDLSADDVRHYANRTVAIFGSGNTAFQIARAMTRLASRVILFLKDYLGVFPIESSDRFSLRAPSLQAIELAAKTAEAGSCLGPLNSRQNSLSPLWILAHEDIEHKLGSNEVQVVCRHPEHTSGVLRMSTQAAVPAGVLRHCRDGRLLCALALDSTTLISAIGVTGNFPRVPAEVIDHQTGFARHENGCTSIPGLFVAGSLGGYASVNLMQNVDYSGVLPLALPQEAPIAETSESAAIT